MARTEGCLLCGGPLEGTAYACRDDAALKVHRCGRCGHHQLIPASVHAIDRYRADDCFPGDLGAERARDRDWNRRRCEVLKGLVPDWRQRRFLDFGCGAGGFLEEAAKAGLDATGYDVSPRISKELNASGWKATNNLGSVDAGVTVVTLYHVLEHVPDIPEALRALRKSMPGLQLAIVEVPHFEEALISLYRNEGYTRNHFGIRHVHYFTAPNLRRCLTDAGLRIRVETQFQRYSLANHLGWLARGAGGFQNAWAFLDTEEANAAYRDALVRRSIADSLLVLVGF